MSEDPDAVPKSRRLYKLCVTLGIVGGAIGLCGGLFFVMASHAQQSAAQLSSKGSMCQLDLAVHDYNDANGTMPGPFLDGAVTNGIIPPDPADRLSWRVAILPFIEAQDLYFQFNTSERWNSPTNLPLANTHYRPLCDPLDGKTHRTPYRVFYDNGALWDSDTKCRIPLDKIPDGASNTLLFVESTGKVPWAQFNEHHYNPEGQLPELGRSSRNTFLAAMADGSVRVVKKSLSANTLRATITRAGGDAPGADW